MSATPLAPSDDSLDRATEILRAGGLVAFPTETVYGLGADATSAQAVAAIFEAKGRPDYNPLICHLPGLEEAEQLGVFDARARQLAAAFWPGALTLVVQRSPACAAAPAVSAGLETIALRVPDHDLALGLLRRCGRPLAAPSANRSGAISPTTAAHVAAGLGGRVDMILDGGACRVGLESTVLAVDGQNARLLRPGGVALGAIEAVIGPVDGAPQNPASNTNTAGLPSPGMLDSHYAPRLPVRLNAAEARPGEVLLAFGEVSAQGFEDFRNLSPSADLAEAAANLYRLLHELDDPAHSAIAVGPVPQEGLGLAINDRLRRAAAPRD